MRRCGEWAAGDASITLNSLAPTTHEATLRAHILYGAIAVLLLVIAALSVNSWIAFGSFSPAVEGGRSAELRTISGYYGVGALLSLILSVVFLYAAWRAPCRARAQEP